MNELFKLKNSQNIRQASIKIPWRKIAYIYLKIGTIGFGGGYAVMDLIHSEIVENNQWLTEQSYENMLSLAEMAPGALTVNILAGIAYRLGGVRTMIIATSALILPSFLLIILLSGIFLTWESNYLVHGAMAGLSAGVIGLMIGVVWDLIKKMPRRLYYYLSAICALLASLILKLNPIWLVLLGGGMGVIKVLIQGIHIGSVKS